MTADVAGIRDVYDLAQVYAKQIDEKDAELAALREQLAAATGEG